MKGLIVVVVVILGGWLIWSQVSESPEPTENVNQEMVQEQGENPFGEGSEEVGELNEENGDQTNKESTGITRSELASHNTPGDCWVAYKGFVYDVTNWLPKHPGSSAAIEPYCGTSEEFTQAFNRQHGTKKEGVLEQQGVEQGPFAE